MNLNPFIKSALLTVMDNGMVSDTIALASRYEGRLFSEEGRLYFVLDVDSESGFARIGYQDESGHQVMLMAVAEVGLRLNTGSNLSLDSLGSADRSDRVVQKPDGWFFATREGLQGPFPSDNEADQALSRHTLSVQGA
jgi:hypothetical protein